MGIRNIFYQIHCVSSSIFSQWGIKNKLMRFALIQSIEFRVDHCSYKFISKSDVTTTEVSSFLENISSCVSKGYVQETSVLRSFFERIYGFSRFISHLKDKRKDLFLNVFEYNDINFKKSVLLDMI